MKNRYIYLFVIGLFIILYLAGLSLSEKCISLEGKKVCWKSYPVRLQSQFCPNQSECIASPELQKHNALVSLILYACEKAKSKEYGDITLNKAIEDLAKNYFDYKLSVNDICDQPAMLFTYRQYE